MNRLTITIDEIGELGPQVSSLDANIELGRILHSLADRVVENGYEGEKLYDSRRNYVGVVHGWAPTNRTKENP